MSVWTCEHRQTDDAIESVLEWQSSMIASQVTRWRTSPHATSRALRGGMLAAALLAIVLVISFRACAPSSTTIQQRINQPAIAFALPAEQGGILAPQPVTFTPTAGKPTLLVFFYTLCAHCLLQIQQTHAVASEFSGLHIVYINSPAERPNLPDLMLRRIAVSDPVLLDADGKVAARYGIAYYPALVLIDGHGIVRHIWTGEVDSATLQHGITQMLATSE